MDWLVYHFGIQQTFKDLRSSSFPQRRSRWNWRRATRQLSPLRLKRIGFGRRALSLLRL